MRIHRTRDGGSHHCCAGHICGISGSAPAESTLSGRHTAASATRSSGIKMKLMSYDQAAKLRIGDLLPTPSKRNESQERTSNSEVAFLEAVAANSANTMPAAWLPTALCEEGGRNDPYAGYFGILEWHGFDGYPTAGSAPLSVQLAWEAKYIGGPPDAPGQCHSY